MIVKFITLIILGIFMVVVACQNPNAALAGILGFVYGTLYWEINLENRIKEEND